jgi:hypothetical protein
MIHRKNSKGRHHSKDGDQIARFSISRDLDDGQDGIAETRWVAAYGSDGTGTMERYERYTIVTHTVTLLRAAPMHLTTDIVDQHRCKVMHSHSRVHPLQLYV